MHRRAVVKIWDAKVALLFSNFHFHFYFWKRNSPTPILSNNLPLMCRRAAAEISRYEMQKWQWPDGNGIDTRSQFENRKPTIAFIHVQMCSFFRKTVKKSFFFCATFYSIETLMRILLKPQKKISWVWIFLKVEESSGLLGSLEIINIDGASPSSQPLWGQFMQKEGQYLNLGKVTIKPRGNIHSQLQRQEFIRLEEKTYFSVKRTYFF